MVLPAVVVVGAMLIAHTPDARALEISEPPGCAHAKTTAHRLGTKTAPPSALLASADTDVLHYHLDIELDPDLEWIGGSNTMTVRSQIDGLGVFQFRLDDAFTITAVEVDGVPAPYVRLDGATLEVTLSPPLDTDDEFDVFVAYNGFPDSGGFGSITFRSRFGAPEIWTLSEPWFAHTWWPGKDDSVDKATADLWFTVPDEMTVASNGTLLGVDPVGTDRLRYRWKTEYQTADYLYCIGATNYNVFSETWSYDGGSMPLDFYIYPEDDTSGNRNAWRRNLEMLDVFSEHYGLYPFADEKYGMCEVGFGGGMEHQTMTSQGTFSESVTAHELAHQWWGDMVTCATWHDIWLNEGFATFSEALWYGNEPGGGGMPAYHNRMDQRRPTQVGDSVYVYDISSVNRIFSSNFTYRKGAWVVHMLRHVLGDEVFFDALAQYRQAFEYASATTAEFQGVVETVSGRDLDWFFQEWIFDIGAPAYRYAWRVHDIAGRTFVELYLQQVQNSSYPIFTMPLDVHLTGGTGNSLHVIFNDAEAEHFLFEISSAALTLAVDPEDWTLHTSNQTTSFIEGPPKIALAEPAPGASLLTGPAFTASITFHKDIVATATDFTLVGDAAGTIPTTFAYDAVTHTVTLDAGGALPPDDYSLHIDDAIADVAAGLALDGEIADPAPLPSGDGLPGGDAIVSFTVTVTGDLDGDGDVDFADVLLVIGQWGPCPAPPAQCPADLNGNGAVDFADVLVLLANWGP